MAGQTANGLLARYWLFLGRRKTNRKQYSEALRYFENAIRTNPNSATALAQVAFCLNHLERNDEALLAYSRALYIAPNYADVHAHSAQVHAKLERTQEAYDSLHRAFRMKPKLEESTYWLALLGNVCLKLNRWEEARAAYGRP